MADPQLKQGFLTHLEETKRHVTRLEEVFEMLAKTLEEEKATDKKLTTLAESKVNLRAASKDEAQGRRAVARMSRIHHSVIVEAWRRAGGV